MDGSQKRGAIFSVSCGNTSPSFKVQEGIFNEMTKLIELSVIRTLFFSIFSWRDNRGHILIFSLFYDRIAVISPGQLINTQLLFLQLICQLVCNQLWYLA
jgi:hypothetical protein